MVALLALLALASVNEPTFGEMVGINVKFGQGEPLTDLPKLKELGVHWVRDSVDWPEMEPTPGNFSPFPADFKRRLTFYKQNDIGVVFGLWYDNPKAYPNTATQPIHSVDPAAYGRWGVEVAKRLKASGVQFVLELWNEPHNFVLQKLCGGNWNGKAPSPWVDQYVAMVTECVKAVKAYDHHVKLLDDDDMWIIHYWYLEKGLPKDLDGMAFHPYAPGGPERAAVDADTDWCRPFTVADKEGSYVSAVRLLRAQFESKLGKKPEMWATEWGWQLGGSTPSGLVTEEFISNVLPRSYIVAAAAGVAGVCWFSLEDSVDGPMGLLKNDGLERADYHSFVTMSKELGAFRYVRQVAGADHPTTGLQAFLFRGPGEYKLVVWNVTSSASVLVKTSNSAALRAESVMGVSIPVESAVVKVSPSPVYISNVSADVSIAPE